MDDVQAVIQTVNKFQLINGYPPASPSKCVSCGKFSGTFIDFSLSIDWYGAVYFCSACFTEGCHLLGFHSEEKVALMDKEITELTSDKRNLLEEIEELKNALDAFRTVSSFVDSTKPDDVSTVEDVSAERTKPEPVNSKPARSKQGSSKSNDVSGSPGVPHNDSSIEDLIGGI